MFTGATFDNQRVKAKNDGAIYQRIFTDGALWGCAVTFTSDAVNVAAGEIMCGGRVIVNDSDTSIPVVSPPDGYIRVRLRIDLSSVATPTDFQQVTTPYDTSATPSFPDLVQEDINDPGGGNVYEMELGVFLATGGAITGAVQTMKGSDTEGTVALGYTTAFPETSSSATAREIVIPTATSADDLINVPISILTNVSGTNAPVELTIWNGLGQRLGTFGLRFPAMNGPGLTTTPPANWVHAGNTYGVMLTSDAMVCTG